MMGEMKKKMRMKALDGLKKAMDDDMKSGYQQVKVMADDKEGLEKGLDKAKEIVEDLPEMPEMGEESSEDSEEMESEEMEMSKESPQDDEKLFEMFKEFMKMHKKM